MTKLRRLARSSFAAVFAGNAASSALGLIAGFILAKLLSPDGRGQLAIALVWPGIALSFLSLGVRSSTAFFGARYPARRPEVIRHAVKHAMFSTLVIVGLGVVGAISFVEQSTLQVAMIIAFAATPFALASAIASGALQTTNLRLWSFIRLVQPMTYLLVIAAMGLLGQLTIVTGAVAYFTSLATVGIAAWVVSPTKIGPRHRGTDSLGRSVLNYGLKSTLARTAETVNVRLDIAVLGLLLPAADVGYYAVAASLSQYVVPLSTAAAPWVFPQIARRTNLAKNRSSARRALRLTGGIASLCSVIGAVVGPVVLIRFLGEEWRDSIVPLWILLAAAVFQSIRFVSVSIANALGHPLLSAKSEAAAAISTLVLIWPLVHFFGIIGAAITTFIAYLISAIFLNVLIGRAGTAADSSLVEPSTPDLGGGSRVL